MGWEIQMHTVFFLTMLGIFSYWIRIKDFSVFLLHTNVFVQSDTFSREQGDLGQLNIQFSKHELYYL